MTLELYIHGVKADLDGVLSMPLSKQYDDLTNPTTIINSSSKTISLPGTPVNNQIFGNIWKLDHQTGTLFDPSKREPFLLVENGTVSMSGYLKLSNIKNTQDGVRTYEVNLFGGLGGFFYDLQNKDMSEVVMPNNNLEHIITRDVIINPPTNIKYFMSYQGKYDGFDSGKIQQGTTIIDNPAGELDEHQILEYRSYYQRPAIKIDTLISQIFAQSGREVSLTNAFKNTPYWYNNWLALKTPPKDGAIVNYTTNYIGLKNDAVLPTRPPVANFTVQQTNTTYSNIGTTSVAKFNNSDSTIFNPDTGIISIPLDSAQQSIAYNFSFMIVYRAISPLPSILGGYTIRSSNASASKNTLITVRFINIDTGISIHSKSIIFGDTELYAYEPSEFKGGKYIGYMSDISSNIPVGPRMFDLNGRFSTTANNIRVEFNFFIPENINGDINLNLNQRYDSTKSIQASFDLVINNLSLTSLETTGNIRSGSKVNYPIYMGKGKNQLDFVKNFFKAFGLVWKYDNYTDNISLVMRNEFFSDYNIVDWNEKIDYTRGLTINPVFLDYRYGILSWAESKNYRGVQYKEQEGQEYGSITIDTNFEFNNIEKELLADKIIYNTLISREYDPTFEGRSETTGRDDKDLPAIFEKKENSREYLDETMQLYFYEGMASCGALKYSDDTNEMIASGIYCWGGNTTTRPAYPKMSRITTGTSGKRYSLDFAKPSKLFYPATDEDYPADSTIYNRFWRNYMDERLSSLTRVMTCYVYLTPEEFANWSFSTFVRIEDSIWHVNKIIDFEPLRQQSTKVELIRVNDINAYVNGQNY